MKLKSLFFAGISAAAFVGAFISPAHAGWWTMKNEYQGPLCIIGQARGNISMKWGDWSSNINGNDIRQQGAVNFDLISSAGEPVPVMLAKFGMKAFETSDKLVSHMQSYTIEIPSNSGSNKFFTSDRTAKVRSRACSTFGTFRVKL